MTATAPTLDPAALRAEFPVLDRLAYLNAGTDGPVPRRAAEAAAARTALEAERGRSGREHQQGVGALREQLRARAAGLFGAEPEEVALTHSTTDGMASVLAGLALGPGDEVLTSDEEHPGLLAPLESARRRAGFTVREVPFPELAGAVGPSTRLVACSHVSWVNGQVADASALAATGVPVLLDGAQGLGAVPVDVRELGCAFYAAAGQKWLCGPDGSGFLFVRRDALASVSPPWPNYVSLAEPGRASELLYHPDARRLDLGVVPGPQAAWSLAALDVLERAGWGHVFARAAALAERLAQRLRERDLDVAARGASTLVSWHSDDPEAEVESLAEQAFVVRSLPGRGLIRASVGAWSSEQEIDALAAAAGPPAGSG